jgi:hypothetical protein
VLTQRSIRGSPPLLVKSLRRRVRNVDLLVLQEYVGIAAVVVRKRPM